ncbi:hypothetical protein [Pseudomonas aeruginosa]|uniref:hypothetical protein n=1 Tax=Pseudomonas aeruginosa TaxID=287 RepID=UPI002359A6AF|nr:hypothetical protein [Pseudomonas aeruginosa]
MQERGLIAGDFDPAKQTLQPVPTTKVAQRQALRSGVNMRVRTEAARILSERKVNPEGHELDRKFLGRSNLVIMMAAIQNHVNTAVGRTSGQRHEFTRPELDQIDANFTAIAAGAVREVFNGN